MVQLFAPKPGPKTYSGPFVDGKLEVDQAKAYDSGNFSHVPMIIGATSADMGGKTGFMIAGARSASARIARQGVPVWEYRFSYVADSLGQTGATHASDIPFFFDNAAIKYGDKTTAKDIAMGKTISAYIVNFAKTGNPNGAGLTDWPKYDAAGDQLLDFTESAKAVATRDPLGAEIDEAKAKIAAAKASGHYSSLITPLGTMLDDPAAKAVLEQQIPDVVNSDKIGMARSQTLAALQPYLPQLTDAKLSAIDAELAKLPAQQK
jgi:para-nitrobenzyl esterase